MMRRYAVLAGRIRQELEQLERVVSRVEAVHQSADLNDTVKLESIALNLQSFYTGAERLFQLIASSLDGSVPTDPDWHRQLLQQMTVEVRTIRPAVLKPATARDLDEYLRFRHAVWNLYALELDSERVQPLAVRLRPAFEQLKNDLDHFAFFLDDVALS